MRRLLIIALYACVCRAAGPMTWNGVTMTWNGSTMVWNPTAYSASPSERLAVPVISDSALTFASHYASVLISSAAKESASGIAAHSVGTLDRSGLVETASGIRFANPVTRVTVDSSPAISDGALGLASHFASALITAASSETASGAGTHFISVSELSRVSDSASGARNMGPPGMTWNSVTMTWNSVTMTWQAGVLFTRSTSDLLAIAEALATVVNSSAQHPTRTAVEVLQMIAAVVGHGTHFAAVLERAGTVEKQLKVDTSLFTFENWPGFGRPIFEGGTGSSSGGLHRTAVTLDSTLVRDLSHGMAALNASSTDLTAFAPIAAGKASHFASGSEVMLPQEVPNRGIVAGVLEAFGLSDLGIGNTNSSAVHLSAIVADFGGMIESIFGSAFHQIGATETLSLADSLAIMTGRGRSVVDWVSPIESVIGLGSHSASTFELVVQYDAATGGIRTFLKRRGVIISH